MILPFQLNEVEAPAMRFSWCRLAVGSVGFPRCSRCRALGGQGGGALLPAQTGASPGDRGGTHDDDDDYPIMGHGFMLNIKI